MYKESMRKIFREALEVFGVRAQLTMMQEECAEAIVAISHFKRGRPEGLDEMKEEIADTYIMAGQIIEVIGTEEMEKVIEDKLQKKIRRLLDEHKRN